MDKILSEQVDKYKCEFTRGTTGGKIGFVVRAYGDELDTTLERATMLAEKAIREADRLGVGG